MSWLIDIDGWMDGLTERLRRAFGGRLLLVGLQGSYQRGEAGADSDIDAVVVLDTLDLEDLKRYRELLAAMPSADKACGFIAGREELRNWPRYEIFQLVWDTRVHFGRFEGLVPETGRADLAESVKIGAANLYHAAAHTFVHGAPEERAATLRALAKSAFFMLRPLHYLRSGEYAATKKEMLNRLTGLDRDILSAGFSSGAAPESGDEAAVEAGYGRLIRWSAELLKTSF